MDTDPNNQCKVFVVASESQTTPQSIFARINPSFPTGSPISRSGRQRARLRPHPSTSRVSRYPPLLSTVESGTTTRPFCCSVNIDRNPTSIVGRAEYAASNIKAAKDIMTDCENTHLMIKNMFPLGVYWPFNAGVRVSIDNWQALIDIDY
ncbi:hypothetical protein HGRIS_001383 [Hohenbuehelia grisea]|uniref:Uncharacterized protein n=1 Tax=Hohenbuehelia grisea TaxID=104357 RepID=A0ABR3JP55_9AGAR